MQYDVRNRLSDEEQDLLRSIARRLSFTPGESVFMEGDAYRGFFVVESGCFKVFRVNESGKEAVLHFFVPGQSFAVLPLLRKGPTYPASCVALQSGQLSLFEEQAVRPLLAARPGLRESLQQHLGDVAEFFRDKAAMLMLESTEERICSFLRNIGADKELTLLNVPKGQLALFLGMTPEAFSRALASLKKRGALREEGGLIQLVQPD